MKSSFFSQFDKFRVDHPGLAPSARVVSVDALRGFDLFWIIGAEAILKSLDNIYHSPATSFIATQLDHVEWTGFRFYDIIMPLFLFIVGVAMPFSYRRRLEKVPSKAALWPHIIKRVILLWILGMAVQGHLFEWDWNNLQFYSNTLQAIASGYLIASIIILYMNVSWQVVATLLLTLVYWMILAWAPVPGVGSGVITPDGNFAIYFDKLVFSRFQDGTPYSWIVSSLNFGATTMLGVFAGYLLQSDNKAMRKVLLLAAAGLGCIVFGKLWQPLLPSVKHIWTSSFVFISGGLCLLLLSLFLLLVDQFDMKRAFKFFTVIGMNAIFAYCASHLFDWGQIADVVVAGLQKYIGDWYYFLRYLLGFGALYLVLWQMYKHKIFIKI